MNLITFCTPEYADELEEFRFAAIECSYDPICFLVDSRNSWRANVGMKPKLFHQWLDQGFGPFLFVDVDGRLREPMPEVLDWEEDYDFGCWQIPWDQMQPQHRPGGKKSETNGLASGTVYINNTWACRAFLQRWIKRERGQHKYGQIVLGETWHFHRPDELRTLHMPQRYCKVFDHDWKRGEEGPIKIEHMQASRRLRSKVG